MCAAEVAFRVSQFVHAFEADIVIPIHMQKAFAGEQAGRFALVNPKTVPLGPKKPKV